MHFLGLLALDTDAVAPARKADLRLGLLRGILKNKTVPAELIKPKDVQDIVKTKGDILQSVNPIADNLHISKIKTVKDGGIPIGCRNKDDNKKLKSLVEDRLSTGYNVREVGGINPRVRIVGITSHCSNDQLKTWLLKMNSDLIDVSAECEVMKINPLKNNVNVFQATVQVGKASYGKLLKAGNVFIGLDCCKVFNAVEVSRCYACNGYSHSSKACRKKVTCPRCGENLELKVCKSNYLKCINCVNSLKKDGQNIKVDHAAWDRKNCLSYRIACDRLKSDILVNSSISGYAENVSTISIYYQNVRGLKSKTAAFYNSVAACNFPLIALSETWLDSSVSSSELFDGRYVVFRKDRDRFTQKLRGGVVLLAVHSDFSSVILNMQFSLTNIDLLGVKVTFNGLSYLIIVLYIPPGLSHDTYEQLFDNLCSVQYLYDCNLIIIGDFNIASYSAFVLNNEHTPAVRNLLDFANFFSLNQYNYIYNHSSRLLDLVWSNTLCRVDKWTDILIAEDLHHPTIMVEFRMTERGTNKRNYERRPSSVFDFRKANLEVLYEQLLFTDWSFLNDLKDVDAACTQFYDTLNLIFSYCVPKYKTFNKQIIPNIRHKEILFRALKRRHDNVTEDQYKNLRQGIKQSVDNAYKNYIRTIENNVKRDSTKFWHFVHSKKGQCSVPNNMTYNDINLSNPQDIADSFADFFAESLSVDNLSSYVGRQEFNSNPLVLTSVTPDQVFGALKRLKPKVTSGPDRIPAFILRDCAVIFAPPLATVFNIFLRSGRFPVSWKTSKICLVYKGRGDRANITNYRQITIISNFSKVLEFILHDVIYWHVANTIAVQQHGFMRGRSTTTNLVSLGHRLDVGVSADGPISFGYMLHPFKTLNKNGRFGVIFPHVTSLFHK
nr:unnamed protein product [Callosobruchus analis]